MASVLFYCEPEELDFLGNHTHFLNKCSMCKKTLDLNDDVFMYQGITAFCSEECRQRQIEIDHPPRRRTPPSYKLSARQHWRPSSGAAAAANTGSVRTGVATAA